MASSTLVSRGKDQARDREGDLSATSLSALETLPTEIRLEIFRLVLQADATLCKAEQRPKPKILNLSLFTVNRQISDEAQDSFAKANVLQAKSVAEPFWEPEYLRARHLELVDCATDECFWEGGIEKNLLNTFRALEHLVVITVKYSTHERSVKAVREIAGAIEGFGKLKCMGLGILEAVSEVKDSRTRKIVFKAFPLVDDLPKIRHNLQTTEISDIMLRIRELIKGDSFVTADCVRTQFTL